MRKLILMILVTLGVLPYLFLATSVVGIDKSGRSFNCTVLDGGTVNMPIFLGSVYYDPITGPSFSDKRTILPYFAFHGQVYLARCGVDTFSVGAASNMDYIKPGDQIHLYTDLRSLRIFGVQFGVEESVTGFGTGWSDESDKEGQTVLTRLEGMHEVRYFDRARLDK